MITYIFRNGPEFCSWLEQKADDIRKRAGKAKTREGELLNREAWVYDDVAQLLRQTAFTFQPITERLENGLAKPFLNLGVDE